MNLDYKDIICLGDRYFHPAHLNHSIPDLMNRIFLKKVGLSSSIHAT